MLTCPTSLAGRGFRRGIALGCTHWLGKPTGFAMLQRHKRPRVIITEDVTRGKMMGEDDNNNDNNDGGRWET